MTSARAVLNAYVAAAALLALAALVVAVATTAPPTPRDLLLAGVLLGFACAARLWVVHLSTKRKFTGEDVATFAAALTLGPLIGMLIGGISALVGPSGRRVSLRNLAFNASVATLQVGTAALVFGVLSGGGGVSDNALAVVAAAFSQYAVGVILVDLVVSLQLRRPPLLSIWLVHRRDVPYSAALYLLGALAALLAMRDPFMVALFFLPMLLIVRSLRATARLREETKRAVFELADLIDKRDAYTHGHSQRVARYAERLARQLRLPEPQVELIGLAARVHDIGKVATPDGVLRKPGPLDPAELAVMRRHAHDGAELLSRVPEFWEGAALVAAHHERVDGGGYPRAFAGKEIPIEAAIIAVADAFDAMTTDRPYRQALGWPEVRAQLQAGRGTQWDSKVVDAFLDLVGGADGTPTWAALRT